MAALQRKLLICMVISCSLQFAQFLGELFYLKKKLPSLKLGVFGNKTRNKKIIMKYSFIAVSLLLLGCSHQQSNTNYPTASSYTAPAQEDNFSKAGDLAADGSRWVWDHAVAGYQKVTSEEYQKMYTDWYNAAEKAVKEYSDKK